MGAGSSNLGSRDPLFVAADDFTLGDGATTITGIHWWGRYPRGVEFAGTDDFTFRIYADDGGPEEAPFFVVNVGDVGRTSIGGFDVPVVKYSA